jgi:hypothetical protein
MENRLKNLSIPYRKPPNRKNEKTDTRSHGVLETKENGQIKNLFSGKNPVQHRFEMIFYGLIHGFYTVFVYFCTPCHENSVYNPAIRDLNG